MRQRKVTREVFLEIWSESETLEEVIVRTRMAKRNVVRRAAQYRKQGYLLKTLVKAPPRTTPARSIQHVVAQFPNIGPPADDYKTGLLEVDLAKIPPRVVALRLQRLVHEHKPPYIHAAERLIADTASWRERDA